MIKKKNFKNKTEKSREPFLEEEKNKIEVEENSKIRRNKKHKSMKKREIRIEDK